MSSWGDEDPRWDWEGDLIGGLAVDRRSIAQPFDTSESLRDLLTGAGFQDVAVEIEELDVVFADEAEWWAWKWSYSLRGLLEQLDGETLERFRSDAFARMRALKRPEGYPIRLSACFAFGTATTSRPRPGALSYSVDDLGLRSAAPHHGWSRNIPGGDNHGLHREA